MPSFSQLFSSAMAHFQEKWKSFFMLAIIFTTIPGLAMDWVSQPWSKNLSSEQTGTLIGASIVVAILGMMGNLAMIHLATSPKDADWYESAKVGVHLWLPYLLVALLNGIAIVAGFILLIIPGLILSVYLLFSSYTFLVEKQRGTAALRASAALVRGRFWPVAGRIVAFGLFIVLLSILTYFIPVVGTLITTLIISPLSTIYFYHLYLSLKKSAA